MKLNITIVNSRGYVVYPDVTTMIMDVDILRMYSNGENVANVKITEDDRIFINHDKWF